MIKRATALAATLALTAPAVAQAGFTEHVKVLWQHTGEAGKYYAWGVAPLEDIDHDGADDVIAGEVGVPGSDDPGAAYVQSGRTGRILHKFVGQPGDQNGFAITDAGDVDRDGVHDILSGAPAPERRHRRPRLPLLRPHRPAPPHVRGRDDRRRVRHRRHQRGRQPRRPQRSRHRRGVRAGRRPRLRLLGPHLQAALHDPAARHDAPVRLRHGDDRRPRP
jgi:hypothetical protein